MVISRIPPRKGPNSPAARRIIASNRELIRLLSTGLGGQVFVKRWKVTPLQSRLGYIEYDSKKIYGFDAKKGPKKGYVFSVIKEVGSEIVADFYNSPKNAERENGLLKTIVLSRKNKDGKWSPLDQPEIKVSDTKHQKHKIENARIESFLLEEQEEGAVLEIAPRKVQKNCQVNLSIGGASAGISGFNRVDAKLWGKIVVEEETKRVYFWENPERSGAPLNPDGRILAQKKNGTWEIVWRVASDDRQKRTRATELYVNFLYTTVNGKTYHELWKVYKECYGQRKRYVAKKSIRGNLLRIEAPRGSSCDHIFSETREYGNVLKICSFWPSQEDFEAGANPYKSKAIMLKPADNSWQLFWRRLSDDQAFKDLLYQGQIHPDHLESALIGIGVEHPQVLPVIDALREKGVGSADLPVIINSYKELMSLLSNGLDGAVCIKWWKITPLRSRQGYIEYGSKKIYGFDAEKEYVFSVIKEEGSEMVARFYYNGQASDLLKTVVLSLKKKSKTGWSPLDQPEITFSSTKHQEQKIENARIKSFLLEEQEEGTALEIAPRKVQKNGQVMLFIGGASAGVSGFQDHVDAKLWGKIVVEGEIKRVYFWKKQKRTGAPLNPDGRILAHKKNGKWEIVWSVASDDWRRLARATELYGNFLYATANGRPYQEYWEVYEERHGQRIRNVAKKTIRGNVFQLEAPRGSSCNRVFSETREYGNVLKICSFWPSQEDFEAGADPYKSKAIMLKPADNSWQPFWRRLSDTRAFMTIIEKGQVPHDRLESVLTEISGKHPQFLPVIDALRKTRPVELYENFLYATANSKTFQEYWGVFKGRHGRRVAEKTIRGNTFRLKVPASSSSYSLFSETREYGYCLKVCSFWLSLEDFKRGEEPFDGRTIMFKPIDNDWIPFWHRLSDTSAFREILEKEQVASRHLDAVLTEIYDKHPAILSVIDTVFIKGY